MCAEGQGLAVLVTTLWPKLKLKKLLLDDLTAPSPLREINQVSHPDVRQVGCSVRKTCVLKGERPGV